MNNATEPEVNVTWTEGDVLTWRMMEVTLLPMILLLGTVGNVLVIYVNHFRLPSNTDTLFKRILATIDLTDLSLSVPLLFYVTVVPDSPVYMPCCRCLSFVALWSALLASETLAVIAVDRYLKLCLLRKSGLEKTQVKNTLFVLTLLTSAASLPTLWLFTKDTIYFARFAVTISYCFMDFGTSLWGLLLTFAAILCAVFLVVLVVLVVLYFRIIQKLRELSAKHSQLKGPAADSSAGAEAVKVNRQGEAMKKSALVFIAVTAAFFACYTPYFLAVLVQAANLLAEESMTPGTKAVLDLSKICPLISHVINPLIYLVSSDQLSKEIKSMFTGKTCLQGCFTRHKG